jgi:hypothetical protein
MLPFAGWRQLVEKLRRFHRLSVRRDTGSLDRGDLFEKIPLELGDGHAWLSARTPFASSGGSSPPWPRPQQRSRAYGGVPPIVRLGSPSNPIRPAHHNQARPIPGPVPLRSVWPKSFDKTWAVPS